MKIGNMLFSLLLMSVILAGNVYLSYDEGCSEWAFEIQSALGTDGQNFIIEDDSLFPSCLDLYDVIYSSVFETYSPPEIQNIQEFIALGGRFVYVAIFDYHNELLSDRAWDDSLGKIRTDVSYIRDIPADTIDGLQVEKFPNFAESNYFVGVDTVITWGARSISILSPVSGTADPLIWGSERSMSSVYDSFALMAVSARYGMGEIIVLGDIVPFVFSSSFSTIDWGDNRQFLRNLLSTNDRADSAWLTGTDTTFTVHIDGGSDFNSESTYVCHQIIPGWAPHYVYATDLGFSATDSTITINLPERLDWYPENALVTVLRVPDSTGETVLPYPVSDTFALPVSNIAETPVPQYFAISAHPNPFNSAVTITAPAGAEVEVFDVNGRRVSVISMRALPEEKSPTNPQEISRQARNDNISEFIWRPDASLGSGVYLIRIEQDGRTYTKPVVYVK